MKIVDFKSFQKAINKLDNMTNPTDKPITIFNNDISIQEKMKKFFEIADGGNSDWNA